MLCYNGLGNQTLAHEHQARYLRFKADESAQAITGPSKLHPEDNNERQAIHEHVSVPLSALIKPGTWEPEINIRHILHPSRSLGVRNDTTCLPDDS